MTVHPVKPKHRPDKISLWAYFRAFRRDILSAQPERLYHAWMAEFKTPFFRSVMINQPELVKTVLKDRPKDFPKIRQHRRRVATTFGAKRFFDQRGHMGTPKTHY